VCRPVLEEESTHHDYTDAYEQRAVLDLTDGDTEDGESQRDEGYCADPRRRLACAALPSAPASPLGFLEAFLKRVGNELHHARVMLNAVHSNSAVKPRWNTCSELDQLFGRSYHHIPRMHADIAP
jgi:hypothetical protein